MAIIEDVSSVPSDLTGLKRWLESSRHNHVEVANAAAASGLLYKLTLGSITQGGSGTGYATFTLQVTDIYGTSIAEAHYGWFEVIDATVQVSDEPVFVVLSESGAGAEVDTSKANGTPSSALGPYKPKLRFVTDANGAATLRISFVKSNGATPPVFTTVVTGAVDCRVVVQMDGQPRLVAVNYQTKKLTTLTA